MRSESFSFDLLRGLQQGASIDQLAADTGVSADRIEMRIRAAILSLAMRQEEEPHLPAALQGLEPFVVDWQSLWFD